MNFSQIGKTENSHFCYESDNRSCPKLLYPVGIRISLILVFVGIIFLTVCGNLLVIISVAHFKQLQTPTNYLVLSLAVSDLMLGVVLMPPSVVRMIEACWYFGDVLCKINSSTDIMLCTATILNLSFISIDRYYAVCQPLHYRTKITPHASAIMILVCWSVSACFGFSMIFLKLNILGIEDFYYENIACVGGCILFQTPASSAISSFLSFYLPGFTMLVIYQKIFFVARKQARSIHSMACNNVRTENRKMEQKATKTLAIVMGVFLSCWTPFFVCIVIDPIINYSVPIVLIETLLWIGYFNSTCNPIVYAFFYSSFRKAFKIIIFGKIFEAHSTRSKLSSG